MVFDYFQTQKIAFLENYDIIREDLQKTNPSGEEWQNETKASISGAVDAGLCQYHGRTPPTPRAKGDFLCSRGGYGDLGKRQYFPPPNEAKIFKEEKGCPPKKSRPSTQRRPRDHLSLH